MGIRNIRKNGDEVLRKNCKTVEKITSRTLQILDDMADTMYEADGVGLAAPQIGILQKIFVIDVYDGAGIRVFINPEILETSGSQTGEEGCLSIPGEMAEIERPNYVKVKALNENGEEFILEATELLARAVLHENDHLYGTLFIDHIK
ncbi:peptide deformylase [Clostridium chauvoei]|uniref:Peptide deformylase n=2 Tax=Clostridium chauvoei TaxID=46867 RepID=S6EQR1_9CLOT|nr:peptide deformylase [Clostridium chauvoei]ATD54914.1 peptide deformylase [Clostridium chauvoei]ATD57407.1 peptide deformylase [Clostridium chauvoei]MBX7280471.1 peptide deformylase [Clostridium chauvoei]MBX7282956.1 peptide deformylase [Clostridium chauvoei]MBX7285473.1 peptide deformylase [Clostridium chauvoei]